MSLNFIYIKVSSFIYFILISFFWGLRFWFLIDDSSLKHMMNVNESVFMQIVKSIRNKKGDLQGFSLVIHEKHYEIPSLFTHWYYYLSYSKRLLKGNL